MIGGLGENKGRLLDPAELVRAYPRIFHVAHADAWEGIQRHDLLSTSALLDLFEVPQERRHAIEAQRRPEPVEIEHPVQGRAWIRDNKPLSDRRLDQVLVGISREGFYRLLNTLVFFWPTEQRLEELLQARAYRHDSHLVLEVDTAELVRRHLDRVRLSPYNLGSTLYNAPERGPETLRAIEGYDFDAWRRRRSRRAAVAEIAVLHSVPDVVELTLSAEIRDPSGGRRVRVVR